MMWKVTRNEYSDKMLKEETEWAVVLYHFEPYGNQMIVVATGNDKTKIREEAVTVWTIAYKNQGFLMTVPTLEVIVKEE